jgi:hypothetical protein
MLSIQTLTKKHWRSRILKRELKNTFSTELTLAIKLLVEGHHVSSKGD